MNELNPPDLLELVQEYMDRLKSVSAYRDMVSHEQTHLHLNCLDGSRCHPEVTRWTAPDFKTTRHILQRGLYYKSHTL